MTTPIVLRRNKQGHQGVLNIAHRGARAFAPENTLPAFAKVVEFGCEMFEIDVHLSKDGELVVHHDDHLTRCTDVLTRFPGRASYFVSDFSWDELSQLDAGRWYVEQLQLPRTERQWFLQFLTETERERYVSADDLAYYQSGEVRLPNLRQTLELADANGLLVNVELKSIPRMYPGLAKATVDLVETMGMADRVLVSSFDHEQLVNIRRRSDRIATAPLTGDRLACVKGYLELLDADAYHPATGSLGLSSMSGLVDAENLAETLASGRWVNVWTCCEKHEMRSLVAAGITGLISDYPNRVREVLQEMSLF